MQRNLPDAFSDFFTFLLTTYYLLPTTFYYFLTWLTYYYSLTTFLLTCFLAYFLAYLLFTYFLCSLTFEWKSILIWNRGIIRLLFLRNWPSNANYIKKQKIQRNKQINKQDLPTRTGRISITWPELFHVIWVGVLLIIRWMVAIQISVRNGIITSQHIILSNIRTG